MSASGAVWNGRFGAFAMAYVLFGIGAEELKKCVRSAASSQRNGRRRLELEGFEVGAKGVGQVGPGAREHVEELPHARFPRRDDVVAQEHGERLVAHERARTEDGVAQPERLLLAHVGHRGQLGDRLDLRELLHLAAVVQVVLQLEGGVEVVLDRTLAATGHDDDLREARRHRLLDDVLDHRLVDQRKHLFRLGLRRRQEPGAEPGGGEHGFANAHGPIIPRACRRRSTPRATTYVARPATAPTTVVPTSSGTERFWSTDRKSTRLNSSHDQISYAVFCLKKKNYYAICA